ncbi:MAG: SDR family NAD(P)-dependent oxidoreductase [Deltaproteobacteria bacterium]|nr:SDR family NAD(P)-dependent oxidoreductase [Deltaproteobacteria bacterium]
MHVLVTGGAGFIGSNTVDHILAAGHRVRALDDLSSGHLRNLDAARNSGDRFSFAEADIRDADAVTAAMDGITHVLHLAAQVFVPTSIEQPVFSGAVNIAGFLNVLDAARRAGVQRFVYASSAAVYGMPDALPVRESTPPSALSPYALEKLVNDQYAALFGTLYGVSCCGLRYFNVYGPRQDPRSAYSGVISKFCERVAAQAPVTIFGDGKQTRDFVSVRDVARANLAALQSETSGVVNVATGSSVDLLELLQTLAALVGRTIAPEFAPGRSGEVRHSAVDPARMRDELGLTALTSLHDGLRTLLHSLDVETV